MEHPASPGGCGGPDAPSPPRDSTKSLLEAGPSQRYTTMPQLSMHCGICTARSDPTLAHPRCFLHSPGISTQCWVPALQHQPPEHSCVAEGGLSHPVINPTHLSQLEGGVSTCNTAPLPRRPPNRGPGCRVQGAGPALSHGSIPRYSKEPPQILLKQSSANAQDSTEGKGAAENLGGRS